ncbi:MAG: tetratricopeptide repeat protein, partial [Planctomycetota bacterium]|nr:tetratricopeptide repeat protein [Planctomycetota bacterium]
AFPRGLGIVLDHAEPDRVHEVINCGGISYASYRLTHIAREVAAYDPDVLVILTGHNEFLERRTYPHLLEAEGSVLRLQGRLSRSRLYTLLRDALLSVRAGDDGAPPGRAEGAGPDRLPAEVMAILDHAAGLELYQRDPEFRDAALAHYEHNLRALVEIAREAGALAVLVTPPSNLADFSPFKSEHTPGLGSDELHSSREALDVARAALGASRRPTHSAPDPDPELEQALASLEAALAGDSLHAELHYLRGRILAASGRGAEADRAFSRAHRHDVAPLRAPARFVERVRAVAAELQVPLVDPVAALADSARGRGGGMSPGAAYFLDHVHPRPEIHRSIAEQVAQQLVDAGLVDPPEEWTPGSSRAAYRAQVIDAIDPVAAARGELNLAKTLSWAGQQEEARPFALSAADVLLTDPDAQYTAGVALLGAGDPGAALERFRLALELAPEHARARSNLGAILASRGEPLAAIAAFRRAARDDPTHVTSLHSLASLLAERRRSREAIEALQEAVRRDPSLPTSHTALGQLYLESGMPARALSSLDSALRFDDERHETHANRGLALMALGRLDEARDALERAAALAPGEPSILVNRAILERREGRVAASRALLLRAREARPDDPVIGRLLEELEQGAGSPPSP